MLYFVSDYMEGAHPKILERLIETNLIKTAGYGKDEYCESARNKIRSVCQCENAEIHFLEGGTQTNMVVISSLLAPYESVIAADTGHINSHEAGAIEGSGHKVVALPNHDGKLCPDEVREYLKAAYEDENIEHMTAPGMIYISFSTEYGTLYTLDELKALRAICDEYKIYLYLDGARMGYALAASEDVTLPDIAKYCDVFYIGGTKVGAFCGEAVVIPKQGLIKNFFTIIKQKGALAAKGRFLGLQFDTLFTEDLYLRISEHAVKLAMKLKQAFRDKGYQIYIDSPSNQQFVVLSTQKRLDLAKHVEFSFWEKIDDDHQVVRFATSWATTEEDVDLLIKLL